MNLEKEVSKELKKLLRESILIREFKFDEIRELEGGKNRLTKILNKVFYIFNSKSIYEYAAIDAYSSGDPRDNVFFQANLLFDLSDKYYLIHNACVEDILMGNPVDPDTIDPDVGEYIQMDGITYDLMEDNYDYALGFESNTNIIEHDKCLVHVIGNLSLRGINLYDIDNLFTPIARLRVEGIEDSSIIEKECWLDYLLTSIINYEKENYILAFFNLFAGFDAFIEGVNKKIFLYYLENYTRLKNGEYILINRKSIGDDVQEYLTGEIKKFANDSRRLNDKLMNILSALGINKDDRKDTLLYAGENFKQREKIRNAIAHGELTKQKADEKGLDQEWFENEFLYFIQAMVKIINADIE